MFPLFTTSAIARRLVSLLQNSGKRRAGKKLTVVPAFGFRFSVFGFRFLIETIADGCSHQPISSLNAVP